MKIATIFFLFFLILISCAPDDKNVPASGIWRAELEVMDGKVLPFTFKISTNENGQHSMQIYNAQEEIVVDELVIERDSFVITPPIFEGYLAGKFTKNTMDGKFIKESLERIVPFKAVFGEHERFAAPRIPLFDISGDWEVVFLESDGSTYPAKGIFDQQGSQVTGTFRTTTGDYRYLDGVMDNDSLKLSVFDGGHAFLFIAKVTDTSLTGNFYSGNHSKELFTAKRNPFYELPDEDSLTFLKEGYDKLAFSFPDTARNLISLNDERFEDKIVVVQLMGTWCPNCLDETLFLTNYLTEHPNNDLEVVALAFENEKTEAGAFNRIERLRQRIGINYPILLAQFGSSNKEKAQEKLPMLNHVLSFPTTIFIDKKGNVRKIHTGFNGPATGTKYEEFKTEFDNFITELNEEK